MTNIKHCQLNKKTLLHNVNNPVGDATN